MVAHEVDWGFTVPAVAAKSVDSPSGTLSMCGVLRLEIMDPMETAWRRPTLRNTVSAVLISFTHSHTSWRLQSGATPYLSPQSSPRWAEWILVIMHHHLCNNYSTYNVSKHDRSCGVSE
jgi:hypothetical protein